ncbi:tape measure protein [Glutamicibacter sp. TV12E]|uniref:aggregation-promoting factor C-terminal-like domain-containing protein n=1 Tax=Glutamicibacter sp. TV12E TaxID=3446362 RepID=UPI004034EFA6
MSNLNMGFAQLQIVPVMTGLNSSIKKELGNTFPQLGKASGAIFGKGVADGFSSEKKSLEAEVKSLESNLQKAQENLKKAKGASATATDKETDALKKLEIAQLRLNESRESGKAKASALARAEEEVRQKNNAVKKAQEESARTASKLENATEDLATANKQLDTANQKISDSTKKLDSDFGKTKGVFSRMSDTMRKGFKNVPKDAEKAGKDAGKKASGGFTKNFAVAGAVGGVFGSLTSSLTNSIGGLVSEAFSASDDTNKFMSSMDFAGISAGETKKATASAQAYADETVYDLSTIQSTMAQLASNGIKNYEDLAKASGNLNAVSGGNAETFKSVSMVMSQTAGAGKLTSENFNQIADAIPGASGQIQKALLEAGAYTGNFREAMADGEISAEEFNAAVLKLGSQPIAVEAAKSTETFEGSLGNLQATIVGGLTSALNGLKPTFTGVINSVASGFQTLINGIGTFVQWAQDNSSWLLPLVSAIAGMAGAILAVTTAVKIYTIAQAALNVVMALNPFTLIVLAIGALVGAFIYLWNNVEGFRNFWITLWQAITTAFTETKNWIVNTASSIGNGVSQKFNELKTKVTTIFNAVKLFLTTLWSDIKTKITSVVVGLVVGIITKFIEVKTNITNIWNGIKTWLGDTITNIKNSVISKFNQLKDGVKQKFTDLKNGLFGIWDWIKTRVFDPMKNLITETIPNAFKTGVDFIKDAWNKVANIARKPINFVIETVYGGLRNTFNKVADTLGLPDDWRLPKVNPVKEFAVGGYTGPGTKYQEAGVVHAGEYVLRKEATSRLRRTIGLGGLDHLNQFGSFPGFAKGGYVRPVKGGSYTSRFGESRGRYPHAGQDVAVPIGTPVFSPLDGTVRIAKENAVTGRSGLGILIDHANGLSTYVGHLSRFIAQAGQQVKAGQQVALSGNTGRSTGPHAHIELWRDGTPIDPFNYINSGIMPTGGSGGGGWNPLQGLFDLKDQMVNGFKEKFGADNMLGQIASTALNKIVTGPIDWIKEKAAAIGDFAQDVWGNAKDFFNGKDSGVQADVRNVANGYGWGSGRQWDSLSKLINKESSWNPNAQNPSSTAYGLFQFLNGTWGSYGAKTSDPTGQAKAGLKYISQRYGDPEKAWAFHKRNNWYANGGLVKPTLYDNGGILSPGQMQMVSNESRKPEYIMTNEQWKNVEAISRQQHSVGDTYNISVPEPDFSAADLANEIQHQNRAIRKGR